MDKLSKTLHELTSDQNADLAKPQEKFRVTLTSIRLDMAACFHGKDVLSYYN